jgi:hypothetical protein
VAKVEYEWWIDEPTRSPLPTGGIIVNRLYHYGLFETVEDAVGMIEQLPRLLYLFVEPRAGVGAIQKETTLTPCVCTTGYFF